MRQRFAHVRGREPLSQIRLVHDHEPRSLPYPLRDCFLDSSKESEIVVTNVRHKAALERARSSLSEVQRAMEQGMPPDIVAVDLQEARDDLEEIIGAVTNDDVLERIFSQFCIGK